MPITTDDLRDYFITFDLLPREKLDLAENRAQEIIELMNNHEEHVQLHTAAMYRLWMRQDITYLIKIKKNKGHLRRHKNRIVWKWKKGGVSDLLLEELKFYSI